MTRSTLLLAGFSAVCMAVLKCLSLTVSAAEIVEPQPDKRQYHLFNPAPRVHMREMNTDRPDKTESPYTVDAGHFQVEMDLVSYSHNHDTSRGQNTRSDALAVAPINLKVGLLNNVDLQLVLDTYNWVRTADRTANTVLH